MNEIKKIFKENKNKNFTTFQYPYVNGLTFSFIKLLAKNLLL